MMVFSVVKINPGPEEEEEVEEAEQCDTMSINDHNASNTFDFIFLQLKTTILSSHAIAARCD